MKETKNLIDLNNLTQEDYSRIIYNYFMLYNDGWCDSEFLMHNLPLPEELEITEIQK